MTTATYASTHDLVKYLDIEGTVPDRTATGSARAEETVGTGDTSNTLFYLNQAYVINGTYTFSAGPTQTAVTAMVETTDYSFDKDNGVITLTSAGLIALGTGNVYAKYSYNTLELTDTQLQESLDRAQSEIDKKTNNHFAIGGSATPDYIQVTNEKHDGKGRFDRAYYTNKFPIPDVSTLTASAITASDETVYVDSTNGFPVLGTFGVGEDKISYTGKTSTTFTGCSAVLNNHDDNSTLVPYIFEMSTTSSGSTPTWTKLQKDIDYDFEPDTGRLHIYRDDINLSILNVSHPPRMVPNRFRATYIWGTDNIPSDIKRLTLMIASKDLMHSTVRKAKLIGKGTFREEIIGIDENWIENRLNSYTNDKLANT